VNSRQNEVSYDTTYRISDRRQPWTGKNAALKLAERGTAVILTYNSNQQAADEVVAEIEEKA
jgi:hypothetical protein